MLPEFLGEYRSQLEAYKLDYLRVTARPLAEGETQLLPRSKFLGQPYLPIGTPYPRDERGQPMLPLAQLNFADMPALAGFPDIGIVQLFVSPTHWYNEEYTVLYHPDATAEAQTDFSLLTPDLYEESPIYVEHALSFTPATEYGNPEDSGFDLDFGGKDYYEYFKTLPEAQQEQLDKLCNNDGHKIGGYATFTQGDPRDYAAGRQKSDVQLLQIDIDEQIMFGDSGVAHLFISPEALRNRQFTQAWFYWDCC